MIPLRLGVNVDHVATVRNARGGAHPDPVAAALVAQEAGADGITMHLREDRRHIRDDDIARASSVLRVPLNFEMAATDEMVRIAIRTRPHACCLVPERREEVTTEGGLDAAGKTDALRPRIAALREAGIRVSLFVDPDLAQLEAAAALGAPVVELHTGAYARGGRGAPHPPPKPAARAPQLGLEVHAGHGLDYVNVIAVARIAELRELNIGHFLIGQAITDGLVHVVAHMRALMRRP